MWQGSEYPSKCNKGRVLNIPEFRIFQVSAYARVKIPNMPEKTVLTTAGS